MAAKSVLLSSLNIDDSIQIRDKVSNEAIKDYAEKMRDKIVFPPIEVFENPDTGEILVADGFHRVRAAKAAGLKKIAANFHQGDRRAALEFALSANDKQGLRRTNADKRKAILRALEDPEWAKYSNNQIARLCAVSNAMVSDVRGNQLIDALARGEELPEYRQVTRGGKTYQQRIPRQDRYREQAEHEGLRGISGVSIVPEYDGNPVDITPDPVDTDENPVDTDDEQSLDITPDPVDSTSDPVDSDDQPAPQPVYRAKPSEVSIYAKPTLGSVYTVSDHKILYRDLATAQNLLGIYQLALTFRTLSSIDLDWLIDKCHLICSISSTGKELLKTVRDGTESIKDLKLISVKGLPYGLVFHSESAKPVDFTDTATNEWDVIYLDLFKTLSQTGDNILVIDPISSVLTVGERAERSITVVTNSQVTLQKELALFQSSYGQLHKIRKGDDVEG